MKILKTVLSIIAGAILGSVVNMGIIVLGGKIISPPMGVDPMDPESILQHIANFEPKHFLFPFLAHALGTFVGALIAYKISNKVVAAWVVGGLFLLGGIANTFTIPGPSWFVAVDLLFAYIPMAWLATRFINK